MTINGKNYIGGMRSAKGSQTFQAVNPKNGAALERQFYEATKQEVQDAARAAEEAFSIYAATSPAQRAEFLERIGEAIMEIGETLIHRAMAETALPEGRLTGERGRTVNQLRLFAQVLREGSWVDARIDLAQPDRSPVPKPDIRHMLIALGPVGIFGASNFPLAFSVAGGDTASALAAGCPVVVKGHPAHPGTSELVASAIAKAANDTNMPPGVFSLVQGRSHKVGMEIVSNPFIKAIGFTGSFKGGKALFDLANQRPDPIPVYAEMGSINPVFILPGALKKKGTEIAKGLASSMILGVGQFCTNPGLVILPNEDLQSKFSTELCALIKETNAGTMLTKGIKEAYEHDVNALEQIGLKELAAGKLEDSDCGVAARVYTAPSSAFHKHAAIQEEIFGPATVLLHAPDKEKLYNIAKQMGGHLTATIHGTEEDLKEYQSLISILQRNVGRILINGYPTGVEVCSAMVHGGPFPATTDSRSTSVGTNAIKRFARPVCYQNFTQFLLPPALQNDNPLKIWRLVDGHFTQDPISEEQV